MQPICTTLVGASAAALAEVALIQSPKHAVTAKNKAIQWAHSNGTGGRTAVWNLTGNLGKIIHSAGTVAILLTFPLIASFLWHINEHCGGSTLHFIRQILHLDNSDDHANGLAYLISSYPRPSLLGLRYISTFAALQAFLQLYLPGPTFYGPPSPKGNIPIYKSNGTLAYLTTILLFFCGWHWNVFNPAAVYDAMGSIISTSNVVSFALCVLLYLKGRYRPSSSDSGSTGSLVFDFYWGMELYPRIASFDIKTWTNCRCGMGSWGVLPLCYLAKQMEATGTPSLSMVVCVALMEVYVFKFFLWESGYWSSMDIAHDRAGYYLCWGCLVWVPSVYTAPAMYLVRQPGLLLTPATAAAVFAFGALAIFINYDSDRQRQMFRKSGGTCLIWGRPAKKIEATYETADGHRKQSLLLLSGWWGLSRHFHYLPELAAAAAWSFPAGGAAIVAPYVYLIFLTALLIDRSYRDDERCHAKYGVYWEKYRQAVPYKIIPGVF